MNSLSFLEDRNFLKLKNHYVGHPIAIYTGAGVSRSNENSDTPEYGLAGWEGLLKEVFKSSPKTSLVSIEEFEKKSKENSEEPWKLADWVLNQVGGEDEFNKLVTMYVQRKQNFPERRKKPGPKKKYKQLGGTFLGRAPTLNALCAFCTQLTSRVDGTKAVTYNVEPNPRVRNVLTTNYDPFLEAASSTMYIRHRLKPVGRKGSTSGKLDQIPVYHIHGYVPYPKLSQRKNYIPPIVDPVLTAKDYENAWKEDPYSFTMGTQIHILRHYSVLFVGFSFRDEKVNDLLFKLNGERKGRKKRLYHYALMKQNDIDDRKVVKGEKFFDEIGVNPIKIKSYDQIPFVLKQLYISGLIKDHNGKRISLPVVPKARVNKKDKEKSKQVIHQISKSKKLNEVVIKADDYWDHLIKCRNRSIHLKQKKKQVLDNQDNEN